MVSAPVKDKRKSPSGELFGTMWKPPCVMDFTDSASGQSRSRVIHSLAHDGQPSQNIHDTMSLEETNLKGSKSTNEKSSKNFSTTSKFTVLIGGNYIFLKRSTIRSS